MPLPKMHMLHSNTSSSQVTEGTTKFYEMGTLGMNNDIIGSFQNLGVLEADSTLMTANLLESHRVAVDDENNKFLESNCNQSMSSMTEQRKMQ